MSGSLLDFETSLVAPPLRGKLFRVDPFGLKPATPRPKRLSSQDLAELVDAAAAIGAVTPVLLDKKDRVLAGHGFVAVGTQLELEDIPALCLYDLSLKEWEIYMISMAEYFRIGELSYKLFAEETHHIRTLWALASEYEAKKRAA
ncbi:MAG: hypothetical protein AAF583_16115 [Pseudomonadota bacterium]